MTSLLTVDVGNTDLKFGLFARGELIQHWRTPGQYHMTPHALQTHLHQALTRASCAVEAIMYASVVPSLDEVLRATASHVYQLPDTAIFALAPTTDRLPVDFSAYPLAQLGLDRLVNACSARLQWPDRPVIVMDFGTATTFDLVNARGQYLGGAILPGLQTFSECLSEKTAKLPAIHWPDPLPKALTMGLDTQTSMEAGLGIGYRGALHALIEAAQNTLIPDQSALAWLVATGGLADRVNRLCHLPIDHMDPHFTLRGLHALYHYNHPSHSQ